MTEHLEMHVHYGQGHIANAHRGFLCSIDGFTKAKPKYKSVLIMIKVRTMKHIASSRTIPSFRSAHVMSRATQGHLLDRGRMMLGNAQMLANDAHRQWRSGLWQIRR